MSKKPEEVIKELEEISERLNKLLEEIHCPLCNPDIVIAMAYIQKVINTYVIYSSTYERVEEVTKDDE